MVQLNIGRYLDPSSRCLGLAFEVSGRLREWMQSCRLIVYQDLPCTLSWGYMVPNSGYLGPNLIEGRRMV